MHYRLLLALILLLPTALLAIDDYQLGPDSMVKEGVPTGKVS